MFRSAVSAEGARPLPTLDGWWLARSASLGGVRLTADVLPALTMLLFDRTLYLGNDIGRLDIDRGTDPRRLQLCVDLSGVTRPADFMAPLGSRLLSVTYDCAPVDDGPSDCAPLFA
jgi:hypothetical protein